MPGAKAAENACASEVADGPKTVGYVCVPEVADGPKTREYVYVAQNTASGARGVQACWGPKKHHLRIRLRLISYRRLSFRTLKRGYDFIVGRKSRLHVPHASKC